MKRQLFPKGVKVHQEDLEDIGINMQDALALLLRSFSASPTSVLFQSLDPVVTKLGTTVTVAVPAQYISVQGAISRTPDYTEAFDIDDGGGGELDLKVEVYFVSNRIPVLATRNFISVEPTNSATVIQELEATMAVNAEAQVVLLRSNNLASASENPTTGPDSNGFVRLGEIQVTGGVVTYIEDPLAKFQLPGGAAVPVTTHADTHLPGGTDPIAVAEGGDVTLGSESTVGLMPEGSLDRVLSSITDVVSASNTDYLSFARTDTRLIATLAKDASLSLFSDGATVLGLNYLPPSASNGMSARPARSDHAHKLSDTGLVIINKTLNLQEAMFGTVVTTNIAESDTEVPIERIFDVRYYWQPINVDVSGGHGEYSIEAPWSVVNIPGGGLQTIGARTFTADTTQIRTELGDAAIAFMTAASMADAVARTIPQYAEGQYPKTGTLFMTILAIREGADG